MQIKVKCSTDYSIVRDNESFTEGNVKTAEELIDWLKTVPSYAQIMIVLSDTFNRHNIITAVWEETRGKASKAEAKDWNS